MHPLVLVLRLVAGVDRVLPLLAIALVLRVVGRRVGLALVGALLVRDDLRTLAACREAECRGGREGDRAGTKHHDLVPPGGGAPVAGVFGGTGIPCVAGVLAGSLYAVAQPHTSPPRPRCVTRSDRKSV